MRRLSLYVCLLLAPAPLLAADAINCPACEAWNAPQQPFPIYGNTYYVGTKGLSALLITSDQGHILIDAGLPQSVPEIASHIRALGFRVEDIKLILNSHVHFDHAGGISDMQRLSGARVAASPWTASVLKSGAVAKDDPQFGVIDPTAQVKNVETIADGQVLRVGDASVTAHFTPGHTPGGTSWSWRSCENNICYNMVYSDSMTAVSADAFRYTDAKWAMEGFPRSFATLETLPCDILLTPHPDFSALFTKYEKRAASGVVHDASACKAFAVNARAAFDKRIATERAK